MVATGKLGAMARRSGLYEVVDAASGEVLGRHRTRQAAIDTCRLPYSGRPVKVFRAGVSNGGCSSSRAHGTSPSAADGKSRQPFQRRSSPLPSGLMLNCGGCLKPIEEDPIVIARPRRGWVSSVCSVDCAETVLRRADGEQTEAEKRPNK